MIKSILYKNKKSVYIFIIFFVITIFMALSISTIQSAIEDQLKLNDLTSKNAILFEIKNCERVSPNDFMKKLNDYDNIYFEKRGLNPGALNGNAIYFSKFKNIENMYPMLKGEFFKEKSFLEDKPEAVVGKNVYDKCEDIDGTKYFQYLSINYKVIGVMGYEDRESKFDSNFLINFNSYLNAFDNINNEGYMIDSAINTKKVYNDLDTDLKSLDGKVSMIEENNKNRNPIVESLIDSFEVLSVVLVLIAVVFLNTFNICINWILSKSREISIKKALGGTNTKIILELVFEYLKITISACIFGSLVYFFIIKFGLIKIYSGDIYLLGSIGTFIITNLLGLISILIPARRILNIKPALGMKG